MLIRSSSICGIVGKKAIVIGSNLEYLVLGGKLGQASPPSVPYLRRAAKTFSIALELNYSAVHFNFWKTTGS